MTEREQNELAWRAFHLGLKVARQVQGEELSKRLDDLLPYMRLLNEIVESETTLNEPTITPGSLGPEVAGIARRICNENVRGDKEIARMTLAGLDAALDTSNS